jgi:hypothetical protein
MNDHEITRLLDRAGSELRPDVAELVARGAAQGRVTRRRRAGAAIAAVAVVGVVGAGAFAAQLPTGSGGTTVVDPMGAPSGKVAPRPAAPDKGDAQPAPDAALALDTQGIHDQIAGMLPGASGPILTDAPFPVVDTERDRILHFRYEGTLTSFVIEPARGMASCEEQSTSCAVVDGVETLTWGPTTADHGYIVSVLSYNAADGKDVAPLVAEPPISIDTLTAIAMSDAWFS